MSVAIKIARSQVVGRAMPGTGFQGDPGLFGFLGSAVKGIAGFTSKLGIPVVSGVAGFASGVLSKVIKPKARQRLSLAPAVQLPRGVNVPFGGQRGAGFPLPFGRGRVSIAEQVQGQNGGPPGPGYKLNKSDYFLRDGTFVPAGTRWVKIRKRNPLNPRALSRAMGRMVSAKKASTMMGRITIRAKKCPA